jgi:hypothetical protein
VERVPAIHDLDAKIPREPVRLDVHGWPARARQMNLAGLAGHDGVILSKGKMALELCIRAVQQGKSTTMFEERVREGFDVFVHDGEKAFGAVREVHRSHIVVYIENAGDFRVPFNAVTDVHDEKVVLDGTKLEPKLKRAIGHAHTGEDPRI